MQLVFCHARVLLATLAGLLLSTTSAMANCSSIERINADWIDNLSRYRAAKTLHESKPLNVQKESQCGADQSYVTYLERASDLLREYEAVTCPGKFKEFDCDTACFATRLRQAKAQAEKHCGASLQTAERPRLQASCGSTITSSKWPPADRGRCSEAKAELSKARAARKSWFGSKAKAEPYYRQAARIYGDAGDFAKSALALEESEAEDVTIYEQAEQDAENRSENLKEAENLKQIARKIELGAYESHSCRDLLRAADYYFQAARLFLKTNEFKATDVLLLRRDQLVAIVDDAKNRGACSGRLLVVRAPPPPPISNDPPQGGSDYCKRMAEYFERPENTKNLPIAAYKVEVAQICKGMVAVTQSDCRYAIIHWYEIKDTPEVRRKLVSAGCVAG